MCNGPPIMPQRAAEDTQWVHCCMPPWPCGCASEAHSKRRIKNIMVTINYRRRPAQPSLAEWTRTRQATRAHSFNFLSGLQQDLWAISIGTLAAGSATLPLPLGHDGSLKAVLSLDLVPAHDMSRQPPQDMSRSQAFRQYVEETDWHRINSKKIKATNPYLMNGCIFERLNVLNV